MSELETDRLLLRQFREADLDAYAAMTADPDVMHFFPSTLTRAQAWREIAMWLGHWSLRGYGMWAVERKHDATFVGRVGLHYPEGWPDVEAGWMLSRAHWGNGYAIEAARASVAFAFDALGRDSVVSLIAEGNERSVRVALALGASLEGVAQSNGKEHPLYRVTRESFRR